MNNDYFQRYGIDNPDLTKYETIVNYNDRIPKQTNNNPYVEMIEPNNNQIYETIPENLNTMPYTHTLNNNSVLPPVNRTTKPNSLKKSVFSRKIVIKRRKNKQSSTKPPVPPPAPTQLAPTQQHQTLPNRSNLFSAIKSGRTTLKKVNVKTTKPKTSITLQNELDARLKSRRMTFHSTNTNTYPNTYPNTRQKRNTLHNTRPLVVKSTQNNIKLNNKGIPIPPIPPPLPPTVRFSNSQNNYKKLTTKRVPLQLPIINTNTIQTQLSKLSQTTKSVPITKTSSRESLFKSSPLLDRYAPPHKTNNPSENTEWESYTNN